MRERFLLRILLVIISCRLATPLHAAALTQEPATSVVPAKAADLTDPEKIAAREKAAGHVSPGPNDGRIAFVTSKMLERYHYLKMPFDATLSSKFFDRYFESYDPQHMHFTQADIADFEHYRTNLDRMTSPAPPKVGGDTTPACEIFNRFVQRLKERVAYCDDLLKNEKFTFDTDERITVNRHELPYPKDLTEAKQLWRERLRFEYLQEHLGKLAAAKKKADSAAKTNTTVSVSGSDTSSKTPEVKPKTDDEEIVETLSKRYHRTLLTFADWDNEDVLQVYLTTLARVYDPHSDYMIKSALDSFQISMNLSLFGIGAELGSEDGYCTIRRLLPGGPAMKGKQIHEKDRIVAVAQGDQTPVDVVEMNLNKAVQLIRGPKGTEVRLTIIPAGEPSSTRKVVALIRDEIPLEEQAAKSKIIELPNGQGVSVRLGVIDLPSFYTPFDVAGTRQALLASAREPSLAKSTSADVETLLKKFKEEKVAGVILDLRRNGGGSLEEAIKLTGLFIKKGPVVQVVDTDGNKQVDEDKDASVAYDGPLMVLTSRFSASASEIVAGALQDYGRAVLVGDAATHGKGTVQAVNQLKPYVRPATPSATNDPGALKVTIKKFYRASGASTQKKGVNPDIVLPSKWNEAKDVGEAALDNPLEYDTIKSAEYDHMNLVEPYLAELQKRSAARVTGDQEYAYLRQDIDLFKKQQADKTISLNEKDRLKELEEGEAREKARDKERRTRREPQEKVYDITLKQAAEPGLPAPVQKTNSVAKLTGAATNTVAGAEAVNPDGSDEEKPAPVDVTLNEAEHILVDYYSLLTKKQDVVTAEHPTTRVAP